MSEKPIREYDRFILRLPDGMRDAVQKRAAVNRRSMNAEIIAILSGALNPSRAELQELQQNLRALMEQRHNAAAALEGVDRRIYDLADRVKDLQDALGIRPTANEEDV